MKNFIKVKPGLPEGWHPKGTRCYHLTEEKIYEQINVKPPAKWNVEAANVVLTGQKLVDFLLKAPMSEIDITGSYLESNNTEGVDEKRIFALINIV